jgi:hypothetical protein
MLDLGEGGGSEIAVGSKGNETERVLVLSAAPLSTAAASALPESLQLVGQANLLQATVSMSDPLVAPPQEAWMGIERQRVLDPPTTQHVPTNPKAQQPQPRPIVTGRAEAVTQALYSQRQYAYAYVFVDLHVNIWASAAAEQGHRMR